MFSAALTLFFQALSIEVRKGNVGDKKIPFLSLRFIEKGSDKKGIVYV